MCPSRKRHNYLSLARLLSFCRFQELEALRQREAAEARRRAAADETLATMSMGQPKWQPSEAFLEASPAAVSPAATTPSEFDKVVQDAGAESRGRCTHKLIMASSTNGLHDTRLH